MKSEKHSQRYLDILVAYSNGVYKLAMSRLPEGIIVLTKDENGDDSLSDELVEELTNILSEDVDAGKISMYEMACIAVFLGEKIFEINKILKEDNIEEKIFEKLIENVEDRKITFLLNEKE